MLDLPAIASTFFAVFLVLVLRLVVVRWFLFSRRRPARQAERVTPRADLLQSMTLKQDYKEFNNIPSDEKYLYRRRSDTYKYVKACLSVCRALLFYYVKSEEMEEAKAFIEGWKEGTERGKKTGWKQGFHKGVLSRHGKASGAGINYHKGFQEGVESGEKSGFREGYLQAYVEGFRQGHDDGYSARLKKG